MYGGSVSAPFATQGLSLDQAPPLAIPTGFFLAAPIAIAAAGAWVFWAGEMPPARWTPLALGLTHLGTLGFLATVMFGALYQMIPVVAGAAVPLIRLSHGVQALLATGVATLVLALAGFPPFLYHAAGGALGLAVLLFAAPVGFALLKTPTTGPTVVGMRLSVLSLLVVVTFGLLLLLPRMGVGIRLGPHALLGHVAIGLLGWIGGLIAAVSWQVLPMFYLSAEAPQWLRRAVLSGPVLAMAGAGAALVSPSPLPVWSLLGVAALASWLVHPLAGLWMIHRRRRRKVDDSRLFWQLGLLVAPLCLVAAIVSIATDSVVMPVLTAWLAIWGWAGAIVHGMLTRIVPFLVWFHRFSPLIGKVPVPPMRRMLPASHVRVAFGLHAATLAFGVAAIASGQGWLARVTGGLLVATAVALMAALIRVLRQRPNAPVAATTA